MNGTQWILAFRKRPDRKMVWWQLARQPIDLDKAAATYRRELEEDRAAPETMAPDTYTGGNFNGVTEGEK